MGIDDQGVLQRSKLSLMGATRSKLAAFDSITQVNQIFAPADQNHDEDHHLRIQAGSLSVSGQVRFKGGFLADAVSHNWTDLPDVLEIGVYAGTGQGYADYSNQEMATGLRVPGIRFDDPQNTVLSTGSSIVGGEFVLLNADEYGTLKWAKFEAAPLNTEFLSVGVLLADTVNANEGNFNFISVGNLYAEESNISAGNMHVHDHLDADNIEVDRLSAGHLYVDQSATFVTDVDVSGSLNVSDVGYFSEISVGKLWAEEHNISSGHLFTDIIDAEVVNAGIVSAGQLYVSDSADFASSVNVTETINTNGLDAFSAECFHLSVGHLYVDHSAQYTTDIDVTGSVNVSDTVNADDVHAWHLSTGNLYVSQFATFATNDVEMLGRLNVSERITTEDVHTSHLSAGHLYVDNVNISNDLTVASNVMADIGYFSEISVGKLWADEHNISTGHVHTEIMDADVVNTEFLSVHTMYVEDIATFAHNVNVAGTVDSYNGVFDFLSVGTLLSSHVHDDFETINATTINSTNVSAGNLYVDVSADFHTDVDVLGNLTVSHVGYFSEISVGKLWAEDHNISTGHMHTDVMDTEVLNAQQISAGTLYVDQLATFNSDAVFASDIDVTGTVESNSVTAVEGSFSTLSVGTLFAPSSSNFPAISVGNLHVEDFNLVDADLNVDGDISVSGAATFMTTLAASSIGASRIDAIALSVQGIAVHFIEVSGEDSDGILGVDGNLAVINGFAQFDNISVGGLATFGGTQIVAAEAHATFAEISVGYLHAEESNISAGSMTGGDGTFEELSVGDLFAENATLANLVAQSSTFTQTVTMQSHLSVQGSVQATEFYGVFNGDINADDAQFNNVTVKNNLTVTGTMTAVNTEQMVIEDHCIELGHVSIYEPGNVYRADWLLTFPSHGLVITTGEGTSTVANSTDWQTYFFHDAPTGSPPAPNSTFRIKKLLVLSTDLISDGALSVGSSTQGADWLSAIYSNSTQTGGKIVDPNFALPQGLGYDYDEFNNAGNLFVTSVNMWQKETNKFSPALQDVKVTSLTRVHQIQKSDNTVLYDTSTDVYYLYELTLVNDAPSTPNPLVKVNNVEGLSPSQQGMEIAIKLWTNTTKIGGGIRLKGTTDSYIRYIRSESDLVGNNMYTGHIMYENNSSDRKPSQLSAFEVNEDIVLPQKTVAHQSLSVGSSFLNQQGGYRSHALHFGPINTAHWMIVASWDEAEQNYLSFGENTQPKLRFMFGTDIYDDLPLDAQEHGTNYSTFNVFTLTAPEEASTNYPAAFTDVDPSASYAQPQLVNGQGWSQANSGWTYDMDEDM